MNLLDNQMTSESVISAIQFPLKIRTALTRITVWSDDNSTLGQLTTMKKRIFEIIGPIGLTKTPIKWYTKLVRFRMMFKIKNSLMTRSSWDWYPGGFPLMYLWIRTQRIHEGMIQDRLNMPKTVIHTIIALKAFSSTRCWYNCPQDTELSEKLRHKSSLKNPLINA